MKTYTINELSEITGFTTRTLRNYIKMGFLDGEKVDGVWQFEEEDLGNFLSNPNVRQGVKSKHRMQVFDFLLQEKKPEDQICVILDLKAGKGEADEISKLFCGQLNQLGNPKTQFSFEWTGEHARVILTGPEEVVMQILQGYYA